MRLKGKVAIVTGAASGFGGWWGAIGALLLLTGLIRWCPAYLPFGLSTGKGKGT